MVLLSLQLVEGMSTFIRSSGMPVLYRIHSLRLAVRRIVYGETTRKNALLQVLKRKRLYSFAALLCCRTLYVDVNFGRGRGGEEIVQIRKLREVIFINLILDDSSLVDSSMGRTGSIENL